MTVRSYCKAQPRSVATDNCFFYLILFRHYYVIKERSFFSFFLHSRKTIRNHKRTLLELVKIKSPSCSLVKIYCIYIYLLYSCFYKIDIRPRIIKKSGKPESLMLSETKKMQSGVTNISNKYHNTRQKRTNNDHENVWVYLLQSRQTNRSQGNSVSTIAP